MYLILSILLVVVGAVMAMKPDVFYELTESWKSTGKGEPSDFYRFQTKLGGLFFLLVGIVGTVVLLFFQ